MRNFLVAAVILTGTTTAIGQGGWTPPAMVDHFTASTYYTTPPIITAISNCLLDETTGYPLCDPDQFFADLTAFINGSVDITDQWLQQNVWEATKNRFEPPEDQVLIDWGLTIIKSGGKLDLIATARAKFNWKYYAGELIGISLGPIFCGDIGGPVQEEDLRNWHADLPNFLTDSPSAPHPQPGGQSLDNTVSAQEISVHDTTEKNMCSNIIGDVVHVGRLGYEVTVDLVAVGTQLATCKLPGQNTPACWTNFVTKAGTLLSDTAWLTQRMASVASSLDAWKMFYQVNARQWSFDTQKSYHHATTVPLCEPDGSYTDELNEDVAGGSPEFKEFAQPELTALKNSMQDYSTRIGSLYAHYNLGGSELCNNTLPPLSAGSACTASGKVPTVWLEPGMAFGFPDEFIVYRGPELCDSGLTCAGEDGVNMACQ